MDETLTVSIEADTAPFAAALADLNDLSRSFGTQLTGALRSAVVSGKDLDDVLRGLALNLAGSALNMGLAPLQSMAGSLMSGLFGGLGSVMPFAKGGVPGRATPFADGGVVASPTYFSFGQSLGVMGEAGAEAILPLRRSSDGRLGVAAEGGGGGMSIVFNVSTPDAGSFRKSEAQIAGLLARAVSRGSRTV